MKGRISQDGKKLAWVFLLGLGFLIGWSAAARAQGEIDDIKLRREQLPKGWKLTNEFPIQEQNIQPYRAKFFAPIDRMLYQNIHVDGSEEIRINYVSCPEERQTATVYQKMIELVGNQNVVVRKGKIVVEILSREAFLKDAVVELLPLSPLQRGKLRSTNLPKGWKLVSEFFIPSKDLEEFEKRLEGKIEEMINQFFFVNQQRLRVNYLAGRSELDAQNAYEKLASLVGKVNHVVKKGKIVVEVITESPDVKKAVEPLLDHLER